MSPLRQFALMCGMSLMLATAACGFRPLYAPSGATNAALGQIFVDVIPNRDGQLLRQSLQERLERASESEKQYVLSVSYILRYDAEGVQEDSSITRTRVIGTARWTLRKPGLLAASIASGSANSLDGNNAINSQFFYGDLAGEAINRRMGDALAAEIVEELAAYFRAHGTPA
jgi:LPS-assembly lipoprotein